MSTFGPVSTTIRDKTGHNGPESGDRWFAAKGARNAAPTSKLLSADRSLPSPQEQPPAAKRPRIDAACVSRLLWVTARLVSKQASPEENNEESASETRTGSLHPGSCREHLKHILRPDVGLRSTPFSPMPSTDRRRRNSQRSSVLRETVERKRSADERPGRGGRSRPCTSEHVSNSAAPVTALRGPANARVPAPTP